MSVSEDEDGVSVSLDFSLGSMVAGPWSFVVLMLHLSVDANICSGDGAYDTSGVLIVSAARSPKLYRLAKAGIHSESSGRSVTCVLQKNTKPLCHDIYTYDVDAYVLLMSLPSDTVCSL